MTATNKSKWYDNKVLLIILLFVLPPLGIVGIFKRNPSTWKKIVYIIASTATSIVLLFITLFIIALSSRKDHSYAEPPKVESQKQVQPQITEQTIVKPQISEEEKQKQLESLVKLQKHWADSIRKVYGVFITNVELNLPTSIQFELSADATKVFNSNKRDMLPTFINSYKRSLSAKGYNIDSLNTTIGFLPNKKLSSQSNSDDWAHPVIKNKGLKIYSGNEYSKNYVGTLSCKYKYEGSTYYRILKDNGRYTDVEDYIFSRYWVKRADSKAKQGIGLPTCY